jgi:hypothetical protein
MVDILNAQLNITFTEVKYNIFKDFASLLDKFYKSFNPEMIQQHHVFWVESTTPTTMFMEVYHDGQDSISQQIINNKRNNRYNGLLIADAPLLPRPGIKPIKQVELYKSGDLSSLISSEKKSATDHQMKSLPV